jgi:hypothetical protein
MLRLVTALTIAAAIASASWAASPGLTAAPADTNLDCGGAQVLSCGDVVQGDNAVGHSRVSRYWCSQCLMTDPGREVVYKLVLDDFASVTASLTEEAVPFDVFLLGSCNEHNCIACGDNSFVTQTIPHGTYYLVVDGSYEGLTGSFTLSVDCSSAGDQCCPFDHTCYDFDFAQSDEGFTTSACGGAHVWEWGEYPGEPASDCDGAPVTTVLGTSLSEGGYPANAGEGAVIGPALIREGCTCLEICHRFVVQEGYDGGVVRISTDGFSWSDIFPQATYGGLVFGDPRCIEFSDAFSDDDPSQPFHRDCFDLSDYIGTRVWIGFFFGSDASVSDPGWFLRWVRIGGHDSPVEERSWGTIKGLFRAR